MSWCLYEVVFRLQSPLHIGWRKSANLQQTRPYLPGKNLWGALTFQIAQTSGHGDYQDTGEKVANQLRFSYFYPSASPDKVEVWPWENDKVEFDWRYLGSYVSAALKSNAADTGMLHETEYVSPLTRDGRNVYLIGYIIEQNGADIKWRGVLNHLQFGGERNVGWGRVELAGEPVKKEKIFNEYQFCGEEDVPKINIQPQNNFLFSHTLVDGVNCRGVLEPLIGRETSSGKKYGNIITPAKLCWMPGGRLVETDLTFEIQPKNGIWKRIS